VLAVQQVGVRGQREARRVMPQHPADLDDTLAVSQPDRRAGVAQQVAAAGVDADLRQQFSERSLPICCHLRPAREPENGESPALAGPSGVAGAGFEPATFGL
jgi:hypothetical protein